MREFNASAPMLENILEIQWRIRDGHGDFGELARWLVAPLHCCGPVLCCPVPPRLGVRVHAMNLLVSVGTLVPWSVGVGVGVGVVWVGGVEMVWQPRQIAAAERELTWDGGSCGVELGIRIAKRCRRCLGD